MPDVVVYWRPGCGFCAHLRSQLDRAGIPYQPINIWEDPAAAATVRSIARGNETVPTVVIGGQGLVNPSLREVQAAMLVEVPGTDRPTAAVPGPARRPSSGLLGSLLDKVRNFGR
ncbi:glutaredoxin-like protein [Amycolatopsis echigonensis]|uniref:Glutaredoxin-like protein n=2 Tax=Pseudonocardiaceae TaxID=2070 RepID=A0A2N3WJL7_9PSEU|nr:MULTISPECIES: glutaredoxin domain-containing protein [Pseudonocardiaceae]AEA23541.1 glutaredoxin-like protein [Pseudonocardia dioxanivorans CB1190]PKV94055.1 glutaredoxin-like protein [Amycolatopsis niigatensis]